MKNIIMKCESIIEIINNEYGDQVHHSGAVKQTHDIVANILCNARRGVIDNAIVNWVSLIRHFVDETTDHANAILFELEELKKILDAVRLAKNK